jgi:hypothetical protein
MGAEADGAPPRTTTEWVYDLRGLDLAAWAARADEELGALSGAHDSVLLLVGDAEADALAGLEAVLAQAGYPARATTVAGIRALVPALPGAPR